jgi:phosphoglycerate kinase
MAVASYLNLKELNLRGQRVFLRLDLNVPLKDGKVLDTNRIQAALPTLLFLVESGAKVIVASHLGRPQTEEDRKKFSLEPVAQFLNQEGLDVLLMDSPDSDAPNELTKGLGERQIIMLENLRFVEGETKNSGELAAKWSKYTDVYVNDAFGACHRAHASIEALPKLIPQRCFGFLIEKEVKALQTIKENPKKPFFILTGGSKVSDKIPLLESFADKMDGVIIGGAMAYTFLHADGVPVGRSRVEKEFISVAKKFLERMRGAGKKVLLPVDHLIVDDFSSDDFSNTLSSSIPEGQLALDIGPKTCDLYAQAIAEAGSVFWNGPMGVYERPAFAGGSLAMAKAMADSKAYTVIGGGDSAAAAIDSGFADKIDHISTGGGASLEFIQGLKLPGLEVLKVRQTETIDEDEL